MCGKELRRKEGKELVKKDRVLRSHAGRSIQREASARSRSSTPPLQHDPALVVRLSCRTPFAALTTANVREEGANHQQQHHHRRRRR